MLPPPTTTKGFIRPLWPLFQSLSSNESGQLMEDYLLDCKVTCLCSYLRFPPLHYISGLASHLSSVIIRTISATPPHTRIAASQKDSSKDLLSEKPETVKRREKCEPLGGAPCCTEGVIFSYTNRGITDVLFYREITRVKAFTHRMRNK